jgi:hypothetical protein
MKKMRRISQKILLLAVLSLVFQSRDSNAGSLQLSYYQRPEATMVFQDPAKTYESASGEISSEDGVTFSFRQNLENGYTVAVQSSPLGGQGDLQQGSSADSLIVSANGGARSSTNTFSFSGNNPGDSINVKLPPNSKTGVVMVTVAPK